MRIGEIWNSFISTAVDCVIQIKRLWFGDYQEPWTPPEEPARWYGLDSSERISAYYSSPSVQARLDSLGIDVEEYRAYINSYLSRQIDTMYQNNFTRIGNVAFDSSIFSRKKKDPGAPYNKYPIVKTKFLDGYEPNKI